MRYHKTYQNVDDELIPDENVGDDTFDIEELEKEDNQELSKHKNSRKSIDEYLERKRLKRQYKDLFDDDFDLDDE